MPGAAATESGATEPHAPRAGVGLRLPHLAEVAAGAPAAAWLEAHPENFLGNPHARELLQEVRRRHPIALHTVGLSVGSADGIDHEHLRRLRHLVEEIDPVIVSGHLAWSTHRGTYLNDLLPLPYTEEALDVVVKHVDEVQQALGRAYVMENPASYVGFATSTMTETQFLTALAERSGCRLLCDVSNAYLSAANMGFDAYAYIDAFPASAVVELHLGGFTREPDDATPNRDVLIDTHAAAIAPPVWDLYAHALSRFDSAPTLIEWDNDLPELSTILAEAAYADAVAASRRAEHAPRAIAG